MRKASQRRRQAALIGAALLLGSCGGKETGPEPQSSAAVPDVASPGPRAGENPELAKVNLSFGGADANGDGRVGSAEYAASSSRIFASMDTDEDGGLTVTELDAGRSAMQITGGPSSEKLISSADNDGDEKLTLAEFIADVNKRFAAADRDGDASLTPAEYTAGHPEVRNASPRGPASKPTPSTPTPEQAPPPAG